MLGLPGSALAADGAIWFGRPDTIPLIYEIGQPETVAVWIQTQPEVYIAAVHIPLASDDRFIAERTGGRLLKPFVDDNPPPGYERGWDAAEIRKAVADKEKKGFTNQGILGFCDLYRGPNVPLHCDQPCKIAEFYVITADQDSLKGKTFDVFTEGYEEPSRGMHLSDTLGIRAYELAAFFSRVHFLFRGDVNADFTIDEADLKYLNRYLEGKAEIPWPRQRADCNHDSLINQKDVDCLKANFLRK